MCKGIHKLREDLDLIGMHGWGAALYQALAKSRPHLTVFVTM